MSGVPDFNIVFKAERQGVSPRITQVYLELSTHCNFHCVSCARNSITGLKPSHFTPAMAKRLLPMLRRLSPERIVLFGFGEALCNPHIREILAMLRRLDMRILLLTNASLLDDGVAGYLAGLPLDEVWVSWDDDLAGGGGTIRRGSDAALFRKNVAALAREKAARGNARPFLGMEIVATTENIDHIVPAIDIAHTLGIERFIVSNLFPYTTEMEDRILYVKKGRPDVRLDRLLKKSSGKHDIRVARQRADGERLCPFIQKGSVFITARGDAAPCPELAYTHRARYFGNERVHERYPLGNILDRSIEQIWNSEEYGELRKKFLYYDFPDCSYCYRPDLCYHRTAEGQDCFHNPTPCGECLWAKGIVICP